MSTVSHQKIAGWLDPCRKTDDPVDLGRLKAALAARGVNGRGWRLCLDYGDALFEALGPVWLDSYDDSSSAENAVTWLKLLQGCEMDVLPPPELVASMHVWPLPNAELSSIPPLYFRTVWKAAVAAQYAGRSLEAFIMDEVRLVTCWLSEKRLLQDRALMKASWQTLLGRAKAALTPPAAVPPPTTTQPAACEWDPYVRRIEWGGYVFVALTSTAELKEEGEAMQHCVGDYDEKCLDGVTRVYSVRERKSGMRVATCALECSADDDRITWEHDQVKGVRNAEVPREILAASDAVLRSYLDLPQERFQQPKPWTQSMSDVFDDDIPF